MSFAEIKKAINSDLTKPLNELIKELVPSYIIPSDNESDLLKSDASEVSVSDTGGVTVFSVKCMIRGIYRLKSSVLSGGSNITATLNVYNTIFPDTAIASVSVASNSYVDTSLEVYLEEGRSYDFKLVRGATIAKIKDIKLYGKLTTRAEFESFGGIVS